MLKSLRIKAVSHLIEFNEQIFFNRRLVKFYKKKLKKNIQTVIDVGANKGQTIDLFLKLNPDCIIHAFEPNPELYDYLNKKYEKNKNITLHQLGVSNITGEKVFYENIFNSTSSFEEINYSSNHLKTKASVLGVAPKEIIKSSYPVSVIKLSDFINKEKINKIDVLKVDVEGHEGACIEGLFDKEIACNINFIQMEIHNDDMYSSKMNPSEIIAFLAANSFRIDTKIKHSFGDFEEYIFSKL